MSKDDVIVLNAWGLTERSRVSKSGSVRRRVTIDIRSEPLVFHLDPKALGKGPAEAIAKFLRDSVGAIDAVARPATLAYRERAKRAFHHAQGHRAVRAQASTERKTAKATGTKAPKSRAPATPAGSDARYAGGKLGPMEPGQSDRVFHDSGRFIRSIVAAAVGDGWVVNVAGNRLDPSTLDNGGTSALRRIYDQLRSYVPQFGDAEMLLSALPVRRAIQLAQQGMVTKLNAGASASARDILRQVVAIVRNVGDLAA